ncbi:alpha/beta fold hydrolase [Salinibacterium sp. ZJ450]|uniref:alpha/beta fold hydrolase n=1 Tax=Salinibacterium sp. ZJ450 TaxID=2708338 RepID=UPI0014226B4A|nr:alpha/beta hydrolase [Salinibacterium sp. ZJ450]
MSAVSEPIEPHDGSDESEFLLLSEVAAELGKPLDAVPSARRISIDCASGPVSAIAWGDANPEVVFLHGGSQNAHTWDLVAAEFGQSALAVDLPGHGRSSWRVDHDYSASTNVDAIACVIDRVAPDARLIVGMSLGGLTLIALAARRPDLVRRAMLVDILPELPSTSSHRDRDRLVALRAQGTRRYKTRDEMIDQAVSVALRRSRASLTRGVIHNSVQDPDGWWRWRFDANRSSAEKADGGNELLWDAVAALPRGSLLLRGALSTFVQSEALERLQDAGPQVRVEVVAEAGHAIQSDQPKELVGHIRRLLEAASAESPPNERYSGAK